MLHVCVVRTYNYVYTLHVSVRVQCVGVLVYACFDCIHKCTNSISSVQRLFNDAVC